MLKRDRKMEVNTGMLLFNGAGVLVFLAIATYSVSSFFQTEVTPVCSTRYPAGMQMALATANGAALSPIELQSRAGLGEWGVLENAQVVKQAGAPTPSVLEVKLAQAPNSAPEGVTVAGINMNWVPHTLNGAESGCLSYAVYFPEDFQFPDSGSLPGLYGGPRPETVRPVSGPQEPGFYSRLVWNRTGAVDLASRLQGPEGTAGSMFGVERFIMPRGRWVSVHQEMVLNEPGKYDGVVKIWIDGKLMVEKKDLFWRKEANPRINGVLVDVTAQVAAGEPKLRLSAPVIGWN